MTDVDGGNLLIEMGSEVEVVATPKKGRGRPRGNKSNNIQTSPGIYLFVFFCFATFFLFDFYQCSSERYYFLYR